MVIPLPLWLHELNIANITSLKKIADTVSTTSPLLSNKHTTSEGKKSQDNAKEGGNIQ